MIWAALEHGNVLFTGRRGGVSAPPYDTLNLGILTDDDPLSIEQNREIVRAATGKAELRWNVQVHGTRITDTLEHNEPVDADGITTATPGLGLLVLAADCLPIALSGPGRVAMIHCGWRGLAVGILDRAAALFPQGFDAAIGPGICQRHYEVSNDVLSQFARWSEAVDGRNLDLRLVARAQLESLGARQIADLSRCTYCEPEEFFSHRRDSGVTGRQAGVVWLK